MFTLPGIVAEILFVYLKPQEVFPALRALPLLYIFFGLALFGFIVDVRLGLVRLSPAPQTVWVGLLLVWALAGIAVNKPAALPETFKLLLIPFSISLLIAHGVQTFRRLRALAVALVLLSLFLAGVAIHQRMAPFGCIKLDGARIDEQVGTWDGRACQRAEACYTLQQEPGAEYVCEKVGLLGTTSVGKGRVRYRGELQDPNELALELATSIPLIFALLGRRFTFARGLAIGLYGVAMLAAVIFTRSRGGQLVVLAVLGIYFLRRFGLAGVIMAGLAGLPVLLLGGRHSSSASMSTMQRIEAWWEGFEMVRRHPIFGVGHNLFTDHHYLTAHNSYVLALAELGPAGAFIWGTVLYISAKIPITVLYRLPRTPETEVAHRWALALVSMFAGTLTGILLLSLTDHFLVWIPVGLAGALYAAVRTHAPDFRVHYRLPDAALLTTLLGGLLTALYIYTRLRPP